jgi:hypothetical protein
VTPVKAVLAVTVILDAGVLIFTLRDRSAQFFWLRAAAGILFALPGLLS